jgi:hypothetical protein
MRKTTRVAELRRVFKDGQSEMLNGIARLAILYQDLRLEMKEFQGLQKTVIQDGLPDTDNRVPYYLRRALETLVEFGRGLNVIRRTDEFKNATLSAMDAKYIAEADKFIQQNWARLKELRNEFAGHIQTSAVAFAVQHLTKEVGSVTWNPDPDAWTVGVECDFAAVVLAGVISSKCQGGDVLVEFRKAIEIISDGFNHAQFAMVALVHAFLWDSFGR